jgi:hypothetical protein
MLNLGYFIRQHLHCPLYDRPRKLIYMKLYERIMKCSLKMVNYKIIIYCLATESVFMIVSVYGLLSVNTMILIKQ